VDAGEKCLRMRYLLQLVTAFVIASSFASGAIILNSPTTSWFPVRLASGNPLDFFLDQQTGSPEADIAGTVITPGFFMWYDDGGSSAANAGNLAFRVRLGSDLPQAGQFNSAVFVGIDANGDGALDLFVGVDNRGSSNLLKIWDAGTGANISPSTTSVASPTSQKTYAQTSANYDFRAVNAVNDPLTSSFDLNGDGTNDFFLSFSIPFPDIVSEASRLAGVTVDRNSPLRFIIVTSQQDNAFNQDLGGVQGGVSSASTWTQLGAVTTAMAPTATNVPEPAALLTSSSGVAGMALVAWRRAKQRRRRLLGS
jgi:hypothetical protein